MMIKYKYHENENGQAIKIKIKCKWNEIKVKIKVVIKGQTKQWNNGEHKNNHEMKKQDKIKNIT